MAAPDGSLKRQAGRNPAEKAKLLVEYAQLPAEYAQLPGEPFRAIQAAHATGADPNESLVSFLVGSHFFGGASRTPVAEGGGALWQSPTACHKTGMPCGPVRP